jgi:hypothetical protein
MTKLASISLLVLTGVVALLWAWSIVPQPTPAEIWVSYSAACKKMSGEPKVVTEMHVDRFDRTTYDYHYTCIIDGNTFHGSLN